MNNYSFEYPLLLLLLPVFLYCLYRCREIAKSKYFVHLEFLTTNKVFFKFDLIIKISIFTLLFIAIASPVFIDKQDPLNRKGKDIVIAIDASGSMNSSGYDKNNDISNKERLSRFEIAKLLTTSFIKNRLSDNIGIVLYGDFAFIASPITYEKKIVIDLLSYLTQGMAGQNTAIGEAIAMSIRSFKFSKAKSKVLILISDGEHNSGSVSPKDATILATKKNIKIYTIAIGNRGEADEKLLQEIADKSGGQFFSATDAKELESVYENIDKLESSNIRSRDFVKKDYFFFLFSLLALFLLFILIYQESRK